MSFVSTCLKVRILRRSLHQAGGGGGAGSAVERCFSVAASPRIVMMSFREVFSRRRFIHVRGHVTSCRAVDCIRRVLAESDPLCFSFHGLRPSAPTRTVKFGVRFPSLRDEPFLANGNSVRGKAGSFRCSDSISVMIRSATSRNFFVLQPVQGATGQEWLAEGIDRHALAPSGS